MTSVRALTDRLGTRWQVLLKELSAFGVVGVINLVVDVGLFNLLHFTAHIGPITSTVISTTVATTSAYFLNRHWSFSHRARTGLAREYVLFFMLNGVALVMGAIVLGLVRYGFGQEGTLALNAAKVAGIALGTVFRFWSYKRWVFPPSAEAHAPTTAESPARPH